MINNFNRNYIEQVKKLHINNFDDMYFSYKRLLSEQDTAQEDIPSTSPTPPDEQSQQPPAESPDTEQQDLQEPAEKPYPELLKIIALALKVNLINNPESKSSNFDSYDFLKDFAETWVSQETLSQAITDSNAVKKINQIKQHLDNILGSAEQAE